MLIMRERRKMSVKTALGEALTKALADLAKIDPSTPEYKVQLDNVYRLHQIYAQEVASDWWRAPSLQQALSHASVVLAVVNFERLHVFTSKAFTLLRF
jgi:hypothetical protein